MRTRVEKLAFNRGLVSRLGLARADIKRLAMAAETQTNWVPRVLGSMMLRPGWKHLGESLSNARAFHIPFVFSVSDKALIEVTNLAIRVWVADALISRVAVSSAVVNGSFPTDVASWTDNDEAGGVSVWVAGGYLGLTGNGTAAAIRDQTVTVAAEDQNKEHALRIVIERGPVVLRVGSTAGGDEYISETELQTGTHSLAFTPTGDFRIRFLSRLKRQVLVDSCNVEASGVMQITAPWTTANLGRLRYDQSGDVLFVACAKTTDKIGYQQRRIERRATRSWSVVRYYANDGPFMVENVGPTTLTVAALSGNTTLTASAALFKSTHAPSTDNSGALFRLTSSGQRVTAAVTAANQFSSAIKVTGTGGQRPFTVIRSGTWVATVTLQRSLESDTGPWVDVATYTTNATVSFDDALSNQIAWYRIGVKTGEFTSGIADLELNYSGGSIDGVCRVTGFTSATVVNVEVIADFGATAATAIWAEGAWSDRRGWPSAVAFHEGRLIWPGHDAIEASISDAFDSFDENFEGDAGPISRTIGSGPVDNINWALSLQRLIVGGEGAEFSVRASSLDEILTPTNFNLKAASTQGSAPVAALKVDQNGIFVQRGGTRVYEIVFGEDGIDYQASHLSALIPEIGEPGIERLAVQRQPDTRVHAQRSDGQVAMLVFDKVEQVVCWLKIDTDGLVEDAVVLPGDPGDEEDHVYYSVNRTIDGVTKRFLEKWAFEADCRGDLQLCKLADSFITYTGVPATVITVAHLVGKQVVVWADGKDVGTAADGTLIHTVSAGGTITLTTAASNVVVGLRYEAPWKSAKLVELMSQPGGSLTDTQIIKAIALILADVHAKGVKYGRSLIESEMRDLPEIVDGQAMSADAVRADYAVEPLAFPGRWTEDERLCLLAKAPRPCTVLAALAEVEHYG